jgi:hypothetical protein
LVFYAASGVLVPWAAEQIRLSASYAEVTPSDEGTRVIGRASGAPLHKKYSVPGNGALSCELYRRADRYITITRRQIGSATELTDIDARIDALHAELEGAKQAKGAKGTATNGKAASSGGRSGKHDLDSLIKDGCGQDFGGDRSRATWYVIHQLLKQGRSSEDIVGILIDFANGISAHCLDQSRPEDYARKQVEKAQGESAGADGTDAEIARLARLSVPDYEHARKEAADRLGFRASILDRLVDAEREKLGLVEDDGRQGRAIEFPEPSAWPEPVVGGALLNAMAAAIRSHVVMSNTSSHVAALWVLHDWLIDCFVISPRLGIRSATKGCGKTLLLDVLGRLVRRPLRTLSITPAATFRVVEGWQPTLLIDEADTFLNDNEGLRGILDGNRKGDTVLRTVGDDYEVRAFATYGAVAIALIGTLPDTLHDRSVVIDLKRRLLKERIVPFRFDRAGHLDVLARMAVRWTADNAERVAVLDPKMPKGVINRAADNWRPLAAIAAVAGGRWPARLAKAATAAHAAGTTEDASRLELLLGDIRDAFDTDKAEARRDMFGVEQIEIHVSRSGQDFGRARRAAVGRAWQESQAVDAERAGPTAEAPWYRAGQCRPRRRTGSRLRPRALQRGVRTLSSRGGGYATAHPPRVR